MSKFSAKSTEFTAFEGCINEKCWVDVDTNCKEVKPTECKAATWGAYTCMRMDYGMHTEYRSMTKVTEDCVKYS